MTKEIKIRMEEKIEPKKLFFWVSNVFLQCLKLLLSPFENLALQLGNVRGLRLIKGKVKLNNRNMVVIASALVMELATLQPPEFLEHFPQIIDNILELGTSAGVLTAIILDQLLR